METKTYEIVDSVEALHGAIARVRAAQKVFATYTQEQVDKIFLAAASAADKARISLAKLAVEETGMGIVEDKVIKNHYAAEYIYNAYKETKTCGVIEEDKAFGIRKIAEPIGVVAAVIPTTNPTSTAIFKCLLALKTRNAIIISPHPRAKNATIAAAKLVLEAAVAAGAPEGIIDWIDVPSLDMTNTVMKEADIILATGGPGMVKAAYSSGKPALGVGAGNTPAIIDDSADILLAVNSIIHSKTFDNGMICASEQSVIVLESIYDAVKETLQKNKYKNLNTLEGLPQMDSKRLLTTGGHFAYLKIAEGCNKNCTYCVIPSVRGRYRSVPIEELVQQAKELVDNGVKELILVAQETTLYGLDLYGEKSLPKLLKALCQIAGIKWIRILYCYPEEITDELIQVMKEESKICNYLDMPIQHGADGILKRMGRWTNKQEIIQIVEKLRKEFKR